METGAALVAMKLPLTVPAGVTAYLQAIVTASTPWGFTASNGLQVTFAP